MLSEQQAVREAIAQLVSSLEASVANARKEAALTADVLHRIEGATVKLNQAQYDADQYLEKVSGVLAEAHEQFASNIQNTLGQANTAFFEQLN
jgi:ABC-type transporter Mla subunit MlaD